LRVLSKKILREFWTKHGDAEQQLKAWFEEVEKGQWDIPEKIVEDFPNARIIPENRVIFNIRGNRYRLIVKVNYKYGMIWIRYIGTHQEYDKIDPIKI